MIPPYVFAGLAGIKNENEIMDMVCLKFGITKDDLLSKVRTNNLVTARMWYSYIMRIFLKKTFREIGISLNNRDNSTIIHSITQITHLFRIYEDERKEFGNFVSSINYGWGNQIKKIKFRKSLHNHKKNYFYTMKGKRGGIRKGAGAKFKYGSPLTETISFRVAKKHKEAIKKHCLEYSHRYHKTNS